MSFYNESTFDRALRIALGVVMLFLGFSGAVEGVWAIALRVFSMVPLVTGLIGWCPFYAFFGAQTRKPRPDRNRYI